MKNPDGTDSYDAEGIKLREESQRPLAARARHDGHERAAVSNAAIADALIKANKDFDMLMIPNSNHGYGAASDYMMRKRWDYFVRWLMGVEPPKR